MAAIEETKLQEIMADAYGGTRDNPPPWIPAADEMAASIVNGLPATDNEKLLAEAWLKIRARTAEELRFARESLGGE